MIQLFSFGNLKVEDSTAIFNFCFSRDCPSEKLNLCNQPDKCYAKKSEKLFPNVIRHRNFQAKFREMCAPELFVYELN